MSNPFISTKAFYNYPCSHRQWRHTGHCAFVHGYSRSFHFRFQSSHLDTHGFVVDFGGLKPIKALLEDWFDHTLLINADDPLLEDFKELEKKGACRLKVMDNCGMEGTATFLFRVVNEMVYQATEGRAWCTQVEVRENDKNSAIFEAHPDFEKGILPWENLKWDLVELQAGVNPLG